MSSTSDDQLDRAISIVLLIFLIYFVAEALKVHFDLISAPGPLDPRENQIWMFTDLLAHGQNPYDPQFLPAYVNLYGIAQPLVVLPFAKLFGDSLWLERIVSVVCLYGSAVLLAGYSRRLGLSWLAALSIAGAVLLILINSLAITAKVDAFGLLAAVAAFVVPYRYRFSLGALLAAVALGVVALYSKIYDVYGFLIAAGYTFLFISMRRALLAGVAFAIIGVIFGGVVTWAAPLYLNLTFGIAASIGSNVESLSAVRSGFRLFYIILNTWPLWLAAAACIGAYLLAPRGAASVVESLKRALRGLQVSDWSRGFCTASLDYAAFAFVVGGIVSFYLEMHSSGGRNYYYQVLIPVALPFLGAVVARFDPLPERWRPHSVALASLGTLAIVFFTADTPHRNFDPFPRGQDAAQWTPLVSVLDGAKDVLHTPEVAQFVRARKLPVYNSGAAEFFLTDAEIAPAAPKSEKRKIWDDFVTGIARKVETKKFDAIFTWKGQGNFVSRQQIEASYHIENTVPLQLGFYPLTVEIWRPNQN